MWGRNRENILKEETLRAAAQINFIPLKSYRLRMSLSLQEHLKRLRLREKDTPPSYPIFGILLRLKT
jgi:hypothetical protein